MNRSKRKSNKRRSIRKSNKRKSRKTRKNIYDGLGSSDPLYKSVQTIKELICWVINMDTKIYRCILFFSDKYKTGSIDKKLLLDLYNSYNIILNLLLNNLNLPFTILPYTSTPSRLENISSMINDDSLKSSCFLNTVVKDEIKKLLLFSNKKLELLITLFKLNKENKKSWLTFGVSQKLTNECNLIGQSSSQILLILDKLRNNGLYEYYLMQEQIAKEINNLTEFLN